MADDPISEVATAVVDPVESVRGTATKRIIRAGIFTSDQIQRENAAAPEGLPYCRITVPQGAEFEFDSQERQSRTVILEFDIMTKALTQTQLAGQLAASIEAEFGLFDRSGGRRSIDLPGWTGASATVYKFGRGTANTENGKGLYYLPVLLYVRINLNDGAHYEI